jgi:hypothetical protein
LVAGSSMTACAARSRNAGQRQRERRGTVDRHIQVEAAKKRHAGWCRHRERSGFQPAQLDRHTGRKGILRHEHATAVIGLDAAAIPANEIPLDHRPTQKRHGDAALRQLHWCKEDRGCNREGGP